jgi:hypothetical protein
MVLSHLDRAYWLRRSLLALRFRRREGTLVDMSAIAGAAGALKSAYELSKAAVGLRDAALIREKVIEMQGEISSALAGAITAQTDELAMLKQVQALEAEVARLKAWEGEKPKYELVGLETGAVVYMLKCFADGQKSFLSGTGKQSGRMWEYKCLGCSGAIGGTHMPRWR